MLALALVSILLCLHVVCVILHDVNLALMLGYISAEPTWAIVERG